MKAGDQAGQGDQNQDFAGRTDAKHRLETVPQGRVGRPNCLSAAPDARVNDQRKQ